MNAVNDPKGVGGWLLVLCLLLLGWQPLSVAVSASGALDALAIRGLPLALIMLMRIGVAAVGIGAGLALVKGRPGAVTLAKAALVLTAGADLVVYTTPYFPNNRVPGTTPLYIAASIVYAAVWLAYLSRSKRVRTTYR
jgi:uncharacterized protein DUF2569